MSDTCVFNQTLYDLTGDGGYCTNCRDNTEGQHCEFCKFGFNRNEREECVDCKCDRIGSSNAQCDPNGKCKCKPGVTGLKCDRCEEGYHSLGIDGCISCKCDMKGSRNDVCDPRTGKCFCKDNVEGDICDR